jgi:hypothetical protein
MSFASNVQMTTLINSRAAISGRTRLNGLYYTCGSTASTIRLYNGAAVSGSPLVTINTPATAGAHNVIIPDGGVLFTDGIYANLGANVSSTSLIYVGGGKSITTYTVNVDYTNSPAPSGLQANGTSGFGYINLDENAWSNTAGFASLVLQPVGTTFVLTGPNAAGIFTTTDPFVNQGAGLYSVQGNTTLENGGTNELVNSITFS